MTKVFIKYAGLTLFVSSSSLKYRSRVRRMIMRGFSAGLKGGAYALIASTLWGLSGTASSALFSVYHMPYLSLLTIRMLLSGGILYLFLRPPVPSGRIGLFLLFSVNLVAVQLTYLAAINYTNAPTATILQYLFLPAVFIYELLKGRLRGTIVLTGMLAITIIGIFELTTSFPSRGLGLVLNPLGLAFGVLSAVAAATYTLLSPAMIREFGAESSVTWGLGAGGVISLPLGLYPAISYFSVLGHTLLPQVMLLVLFVSVLGTMLAFTLFIKSMSSISATQASLSATMEPLAAAASSFVFLGLAMSPLQYFGGALIVGSIVMVQIKGGGMFSERES